VLGYSLAAKSHIASAKSVVAGTDIFRVLFFVLTFFTIGVSTNVRRLWQEGIGRLAAVYVVCLFGFIIWIGLGISWLFFHGVKPPLAGP
jgi:Kef-type K+ transport system membrane component KefB